MTDRGTEFSELEQAYYKADAEDNGATIYDGNSPIEQAEDAIWDYLEEAIYLDSVQKEPDCLLVSINVASTDLLEDYQARVEQSLDGAEYFIRAYSDDEAKLVALVGSEEIVIPTNPVETAVYADVAAQLFEELQAEVAKPEKGKPSRKAEIERN